MKSIAVATEIEWFPVMLKKHYLFAVNIIITLLFYDSVSTSGFMWHRAVGVNEELVGARGT